jgi:hypothetical protein
MVVWLGVEEGWKEVVGSGQERQWQLSEWVREVRWSCLSRRNA